MQSASSSRYVSSLGIRRFFLSHTTMPEAEVPHNKNSLMSDRSVARLRNTNRHTTRLALTVVLLACIADQNEITYR